MYTQSKEVDLDREYMPSFHTTRYKEHDNYNEIVVENFMKVTGEETERVRAKYRVRQDVRYGGVHDNQILDIYYKEKENDTPIFVFIHGGYWQFLDKSTAGSFVAPLVERNYRVIAMDYNLCPQVTLEELMKQQWSFYEWLFAYAKETNCSKITICGHSAGAHLASLLLTTNLINTPLADRISSIFLICGVYDLRELWRVESANPKNILSIDSLAIAEKLSPFCMSLNGDVIEFCQKNNIKVFVLVAENDSETFIGQSREYAKKLNDAGIPTIYKLFENYDHCDIIEEVPISGSQINRYILENLN